MKEKTKSMRRLTMVGLVMILLSSSMLFAANSGVLRLEAYVPELVEITVTPNTDIGMLNLTLKGDNITVGHVEERANSQTGYEVELMSANAVGDGTPSLDPEDPENTVGLDYTIYYNGVEVEFDTTGKAVVTDATTMVSAGITKSVSISYDGTVVELDSGYYSDTLTFSIVPK